jgi:hypothetical protein
LVKNVTFWLFEEISIFSNSSHLERTEPSDLILKEDHIMTIPAKLGLIKKFGSTVSE